MKIGTIYLYNLHLTFIANFSKTKNFQKEVDFSAMKVFLSKLLQVLQCAPRTEGWEKIQ